MFGRDPFEPVLHSDVRAIIAEQSNTPATVMEHGVERELPEGILIYDASTGRTLEEIAQALKARGELKLVAGCAGFASVLPGVLGLIPGSSQMPTLHRRFLTICGSINPITLQQLDTAEKQGALRLQLTPKQKLNPGWLHSSDGEQAVDLWFRQIQKDRFCCHRRKSNRRGRRHQAVCPSAWDGSGDHTPSNLHDSGRYFGAAAASGAGGHHFSDRRRHTAGFYGAHRAERSDSHWGTGSCAWCCSRLNTGRNGIISFQNPADLGPLTYCSI